MEVNQKEQVFIERSRGLNIMNGAGKFLNRLGFPIYNLDARSIVKKAKKDANYAGEVSNELIVGLEQLVHSINKESRINAFGSIALKGLLKRTLTSRLKVEQSLYDNPDILQSKITAPVFIIGMPRTGTTILHSLLHEDVNHRSPLAWECLLPSPVPEPSTFSDNPQLNTIKKEFGQLFKLVPDFQKKHHMTAESPQECIGITALDFNSFQTCAQVYIPSYLKWFAEESDQLQTMRFHRRFLQYLESGGVRSERWLLKTPVHMMRLSALFEVYPDARIIMTHRDPAKVVPSAASLISSVRSLYSDYEDPARSGMEQLDFWKMSFDRFMADRAQLNKENQILDLHFNDFVQDQMACVDKIYSYFDWSLDDASRSKMKDFLASNPKGKHGSHEYCLEDFNLTQSQVSEEFKEYYSFLDKMNYEK
ncbi:MAG: sulfotransferase family protein [Chitinophagales bacterium]